MDNRLLKMYISYIYIYIYNIKLTLPLLFIKLKLHTKQYNIQLKISEYHKRTYQYIYRYMGSLDKRLKAK